MKLVIMPIDNYWTVNGKRFNDLTDEEKDNLIKFIKNYDNNRPKIDSILFNNDINNNKRN